MSIVIDNNENVQDVDYVEVGGDYALIPVEGEESNVWDIQEGEPVERYRSFWDYVMLGSTRSVGDLRKEYLRKSKVYTNVRSQKTLYRWCREHSWVERAEAFDRWLIERDKKVMIDARRKHLRQSLLDASMLEDVWRDMAVELQNHQRVAITEEILPDGTIKITELVQTNWDGLEKAVDVLAKIDKFKLRS